MAGVSGPGSGGGGIGNLPPVAPSTTEELQEEQQDAALKDINKKTTTVLTQRRETQDGFAVASEARLLVRSEDAEFARAKLLDTTLPDVLTIVEGAFNLEVDAARLLKLQPKALQDPAFQAIVQDVRISVEEWQKEVLIQLENAPETIPLPDLSQLERPQNEAAVEVAAEATTTASAAATETQVESHATDATTTASESESLHTEAEASEDAVEQNVLSDETSQALVTDTGTETEDVDDDHAAGDVDDQQTLSFEEQALNLHEELTELQEDWPTDTRNLSPAQQFLVNIMPPPTTPANGGEPRFDEHGNEIVEEEYYDRIDAATEAFGPSQAQVAAYNALVFQLSQPVVLTPEPAPLSDEGGGQRIVGGGTGDGGGGGGFGGGGGTIGGGSGIGPAKITVELGTDGLAKNPAVIRAGDALSGLSLMGDGDIMMYAILVLMETVKDLNNEVKDKMKWAKIHHKMNDAMRKHFADVLKQLAPLTRPENSEHMPEGTFIHNLYPEPVIGPTGEPTGEVTMVEKEVETPYSTQTAEKQDGVTPHPMSADDQVKLVQDKMNKAGLPPPKIRDGGNGTIFVSSCYTYATIDHAPMMKERLRNELSTLKMDMDKQMLSVQKTVSMRKNVFDNLNKIIKGKSEEWGKMTAQLRR